MLILNFNDYYVLLLDTRLWKIDNNKVVPWVLKTTMFIIITWLWGFDLTPDCARKLYVQDAPISAEPQKCFPFPSGRNWFYIPSKCFSDSQAFEKNSNGPSTGTDNVEINFQIPTQCLGIAQSFSRKGNAPLLTGFPIRIAVDTSIVLRLLSQLECSKLWIILRIVTGYLR